MMAGHYAHAKQFNRHRRQLRTPCFLTIRLSPLIAACSSLASVGW
jgi:hypothetical protein